MYLTFKAGKTTVFLITARRPDQQSNLSNQLICLSTNKTITKSKCSETREISTNFKY